MLSKEQKDELSRALEGKTIIGTYRGRYTISLQLSNETVVEFGTTARGPAGEEPEITVRILKV